MLQLPPRRRLSELHPLLYQARIQQLRLARRLADRLAGHRFAVRRAREDLEFRCARHQSLLRRRLGSSDPRLQENKVVNLRLAVAAMDGVLVRPGETFSFWRLVGEPSARKGYIEGLQLSRGEVRTGVGGGLCQLANLLYWMALHTPLEVVERHHHSFDPFPDDRRVLPFGSGASVFYNYVDLRFHNPSELTFQVRVRVGDRHLEGSFRCDGLPPLTYTVFEREHRFFRDGERNFRTNEIWRRACERATGREVGVERLLRNLAEVKYEISAT